MKIDIGECFIQRCRPRDALEHMKACQESANYLGDYLGWGVDAPTWNFKQHASWILHHARTTDPHESYCVYFKNKLIGFFSYGSGADKHGIQICYWVRKGYEGNGVATAVTEILTQKAFFPKRFGYVEIHVDKANLASRKVPEKLGFEIDEEYRCLPHGTKETGEMLVYVKYNPNQPKHHFANTYTLGNGTQSFMAWSQTAKLLKQNEKDTDEENT